MSPVSIASAKCRVDACVDALSPPMATLIHDIRTGARVICAPATSSPNGKHSSLADACIPP